MTPPNGTERFGFPPLHDVFTAHGSALDRGPGFLHLNDAIRYVKEHKSEGPFLIRRPDGRWYQGGELGSGVGRA